MNEHNYHLGIETSHQGASLSLAVNSHIMESILIPQEQNQRSRMMVPLIKDLLSRHSIKPANLDWIHVSSGPGSFTGLRIGMMIAKTISFAAGIKLKAVPTFQVLADQVIPHENENFLTVISDAQRGEVFFQNYERRESIWIPLNETTTITFDQLIRDHTNENSTFTEENRSNSHSLNSSCNKLLTGPALKRYGSQFISNYKLSSADTWVPRADQVILTGQKLLSNNTQQVVYSDDPFQLVPVYIRASAAEEKKKQGA